MSHYQKGANFERELIREFWANGWSAVRAAGSGTVGEPVPDVVAIKDSRVILLECKATRKEKLSLKEAILGLRIFAEISGVEAYIAMKFLKQKPRFYNIRDFVKKGKYTISLKTEFLSFELLIGKQSKL